MLDNIEYSFLPGRFVTTDETLLTKCSSLYSNHYGIWSNKGIRPQKQIKLSNSKLCEWLENDNVTLYYATHNEELIGYAISFSKDEKNSIEKNIFSYTRSILPKSLKQIFMLL